MKNLIWGGALVALVVLASPSRAALHTISPGDTITVRYSGINYRSGTGGEFQVGKVNAPADTTYFHTFCAETGENLGSNTQQYYVKSVGLVSMSQGGVLGENAAKLYRDYYDAMAALDYGFQSVVGGTYTGPGNDSWDFTLGGVFTFDMTSAASRAASGAAVQKVLWNMLGYAVGLNGTEQALKNAYAGYLGTGNYYDVRLANLVNPSNHSTRYQDQFVVVVPEASTIAVWSVLSLVGAGIAYRKREQS